MSDALNGMERDQEEARLKKIDVKKIASELRYLHEYKTKYLEIRNDLIKLGYLVQDEGPKIRIFKEI